MKNTIQILCPKCKQIMFHVELSQLTNRVLSIKYINYEYGKEMNCPFDGNFFYLKINKKIFTSKGWL